MCIYICIMCCILEVCDFICFSTNQINYTIERYFSFLQLLCIVFITCKANGSVISPYFLNDSFYPNNKVKDRSLHMNTIDSPFSHSRTQTIYLAFDIIVKCNIYKFSLMLLKLMHIRFLPIKFLHLIFSILEESKGKNHQHIPYLLKGLSCWHNIWG